MNLLLCADANLVVIYTALGKLWTIYTPSPQGTDIRMGTRMLHVSVHTSIFISHSHELFCQFKRRLPGTTTCIRQRSLLRMRLPIGYNSGGFGSWKLRPLSLINIGIRL